MSEQQAVPPEVAAQGTEPTGAPVRDVHGSSRADRSRSNADEGDASIAIEATGVTKEFEGGAVRALDGVDLRIRRGEFVAIMGPSGCGKSTLLHLLAALDSPTTGTIRVEGQDLAHLADLSRYRRQTVGLVFQLHSLLPRLSALGNVEVAMFGSRRPNQQRKAWAHQILAELDLAGREHRRPTQLSGGERQRVAIARALANDPPVLLADEPTGSLDSAASENVLARFVRLQREHGVTTVLVTHHPAVAEAASRILHMRDGRIRESIGA
ncbi:MAG: ABC transporter ATP-binding protein [Acidimicrobiales bacterium]|jgi:putative ABC transport system ATP-binding protein